MTNLQKQRLWILVFFAIGIGSACGFGLLALKNTINLYLTPSQVATGQAPYDKSFRMGGLVKLHSLKQSAHSSEIQFLLTDKVHDVPIAYTGPLPDLFREGQGIVVEGQLHHNGIYIAKEILAKHDERYMPKAAQDALKKAQISPSPQK
jgi:cytochrome c-type biogenesis protein CcmE